MYSKEAVETCGDALLDLVDYCSRKMVFLNAWQNEVPENRSAQELLSLSEEDVSHLKHTQSKMIKNIELNKKLEIH